MRTFDIDGKTYKLPDAEDFQLARDFVRYAESLRSDPIAEIKPLIKDLAPSVQETMLKAALEEKKNRRPLQPDSPEVAALLLTVEGANKYLQLAYSRYQPDMSIDEVWRIHNKAIEQYPDLFNDSRRN